MLLSALAKKLPFLFVWGFFLVCFTFFFFFLSLRISGLRINIPPQIHHYTGGKTEAQNKGSC